MCICIHIYVCVCTVIYIIHDQIYKMLSTCSLTTSHIFVNFSDSITVASQMSVIKWSTIHSVSLYVCMHIRTHKNIQSHVQMPIYINVDIYMYTHVHSHTYTSVYISLYSHTFCRVLYASSVSTNNHFPFPYFSLSLLIFVSIC